MNTAASASAVPALATASGALPGPQPAWAVGPFTKLDAANPVLAPRPDARFTCPFLGPVAWEAKDVFNPAATVVDGQVHLLYRAEDRVGRHAGVSRIGLASAADGLRFTCLPEPVLAPARDAFAAIEWEGGCEDPRVVLRDDGVHVLTYTAYDGMVARLCVATSRDLRRWTKHGPAFAAPHADLWAKSGSIVCRRDGERLIAVRLRGVYWMYYGESDVFTATSDDLITWRPVTGRAGQLRSALIPRAGRADSELVEPGPPALLTDAGIVLIYNCKNAAGAAGDQRLAVGAYAPHQALFDPCEPSACIARTSEPFLVPDRAYEIAGQVNQVVFVEGLVPFKGKWHLYYGTADSRIAVATAPL